jgi:hypothetical protein
MTVKPDFPILIHLSSSEFLRTPARWGDNDEETEVSSRLLSNVSGWQRNIETKAVKKKMLSE